ncbi:hypothetical protein BDV19DRAFT_200248 [Aspergillus venezuelensis]
MDDSSSASYVILPCAEIRPSPSPVALQSRVVPASRTRFNQLLTRRQSLSPRRLQGAAYKPTTFSSTRIPCPRWTKEMISGWGRSFEVFVRDNGTSNSIAILRPKHALPTTSIDIGAIQSEKTRSIFFHPTRLTLVPLPSNHNPPWTQRKVLRRTPRPDHYHTRRI